jgi:hypothetical protein
MPGSIAGRPASIDGDVHAVVATVRVEDVEAARAALEPKRLGVVPRAPGFVAAYWLEPLDGIGLSVIVFESKADAEAALGYSLEPLPGVTLLEISVREVLASA